MLPPFCSSLLLHDSPGLTTQGQENCPSGRAGVFPWLYKTVAKFSGRHPLACPQASPTSLSTTLPLTEFFLCWDVKNQSSRGPPRDTFLQQQNAPSHRKFQVSACVCGRFFRMGGGISHPDREKASEVVNALKEIIPWCGLPNTLQSDNGSAFLLSKTQQVSEALQINWKLHSSRRPQSTGKTEKMNHTLKKEHCWDFPGSPVVKTPSSQCRGHRFDPWSGN